MIASPDETPYAKRSHWLQQTQRSALGEQAMWSLCGAILGFQYCAQSKLWFLDDTVFGGIVWLIFMAGILVSGRRRSREYA